MIFAESAFLLLLISWAALVLLRFSRRDRLRRVVGTLALWRLVAEKSQASRRRRYWPLDLLLEALLGLVLIVMLSQPQWQREEPIETWVLIDSGSAMQAAERAAELDAWLQELESQVSGRLVLRYWPERDDSLVFATDTVLWADKLKSLQAPNREIYLAADAILDLERIPSEIGIKVIRSPFANIGITSIYQATSPEGLELSVGLSRTPESSAGGTSLVARAVDDKSLLERLALPDFQAHELVQLHLNAPLPKSILLQLEGGAGPQFDDHVQMQLEESRLKFALVDFEGQGAWRAALEASGQNCERLSSAELAPADVVLIHGGPRDENAGFGIQLGGDPGDSTLGFTTDPGLGGKTLVAEAGAVLEGLVGLEALAGRSGAYFAGEDPRFDVLARRAGKAVILLDDEERRIFFADPESRSGWAQEVAFPLLVQRLLGALKGDLGGPHSEPLALSSSAESRAEAAAAASSRPAKRAQPDEISSPFWRELAAFGLLLQGILLFRRRKELMRRESSPAC